MAITNFIPTIWSETLYEQLDKKYIAVANCTRAWEGDIKQCGDRVKICGIGPVSVFDYTKNQDLPAPTALKDSARELVINQAKAFNFQIDDIDRAQMKPDIMNQAMRTAAKALANYADSYVYSLYTEVDSNHVISATGKSNEEIVDIIIKAIINFQNIGVHDDLVLEVSPEVASKIYRAKLDLLSDNNDLFETGCIGSIAGCKIYVTHNLHTVPEGPFLKYKCFLRTKRAIAFAEQLSEIEAYRPELRFADAVKGLYLYGAKIVYPDELKIIEIDDIEN